MTWDPEKSVETLTRAVDHYDWDAAAELCEELVEYLHETDLPYSVDGARQVLGLLRKKRYFDLMQRVGDVLIQTGQDAPRIRKLYAQSQIDLGNLAAAISTLERLKADTDGDPDEEGENAEARGLLGRVYKQLYVNAANPKSARSQDHIQRSIAYYYDVYLSNRKKHYWHGINTVALLLRAEVDGVELQELPDRRSTADSLAREILNTVEGLWNPKKPDTWASATAVEASIALGHDDEALSWLARYLGTPNADAFELASTHRQLVEVWRLTADTRPGDRVLPTIAARMLKCRDGAVEVSASDLSHDALQSLRDSSKYEEAVGGYFEDFKWFVDGVSRGRGVASVHDKYDRHRATGFLVRGGDLSEALAGETLLLTNAHVISVDERDSQFAGTIAPGEGTVRFDPDRKDEGIRVTEIVWTSYIDELDTTLVRLASKPRDIDPFPIAAALPDPNAEERERVYIIGHPIGRETLSYSMNDNEYVGHSDQYIYYRTITRKRNSGSPVFNKRWELIGIHHYGMREIRLRGGNASAIRANEGISIHAMRSRIREGEVLRRA